MIKKFDYQKLIDLYKAYELDEIYSNNSINRLKVKEEIGKNTINFTNKSFNKTTKSDLITTNITSTSLAISKLAQRNILSDNKEQQQDIQNASSNFKFMSLNEIIDSAKSLAKKASNIDELKNAVQNFEGCNLKKMATNTVFCDGNQKSKIMVIGEAPGNNEDLSGIPFCGDSGELLTSMFNSINLKRKKDYYITNVIFWRPPGNRRPTHEELAICKPFVERHIELFNPKIIILVGATAMTAILNNSDTISSVRGKFIDFSPSYLSNSTKIFTIFHPSYLMRQPSKKKLAWHDMLKIQEFIKNL